MKNTFLIVLVLTLLIGCSSDTEFTIPPNKQIVNENNDSIPPPLQFPISAPCDGGSAGGFLCDGYDLIYRFDLETLNAQRGNDCWGWTDPGTGKEYALMGLNNGTAFVDLSNPEEPIYLGKLSTASSASNWRDVKVYNNFAFVVSEAAGHGMQIFDLTKLRDVSNPPVNFNADRVYTGFGNAHNVVINEDTGYAYAVGTNTYNGGPHFVNIQDPMNPVGEGGYSLGQYSHDAQVVTYSGPDTDYTGKEILVGSNEDEIVIVDITDKNNPEPISTISYGDTGYTHQGWFTEDQRYFLVGDELDERDLGINSRTLIFDFSDLDAPSLNSEYFGPTSAIDHNGYVKGNTYYLANYARGLSIIDISQIGGNGIGEVGYFDTYPENNQASFSGAWSVYPYFDSGHIIISDINKGLFIIKQSN